MQSGKLYPITGKVYLGKNDKRWDKANVKFQN